MTGRTNLVSVSPAAPASVTVAPAPLALPPRAPVRATLWRRRSSLGGRRAKYMLCVDNRSNEAVDTLTYAVAAKRSDPAEPAAVVAVPAGASLRLALTVALPPQRPVRVVTEVRTRSGTLVFEEVPPPRTVRSRVVGALAVLAAAAALYAGAEVVHPSVTALVVPSDVRANRPFAVAYAVARANTADYSVDSPDGYDAGRGTLSRAEGSFDVVLPRESEPHAYDIRVTAHSRFGDAVRTVRVVAGPAPLAVIATVQAKPRPRAQARPPFTIDRLTLDRDTVAGGRPVLVYYRLRSVDGMVRLIDQVGTVRAEALLDRRGNSILVAPYVDTDEDFRVVVDASQGALRAEKSIALRVTKAHSLDDTLATARRTHEGPIALVETQVAAGDPIEIGVVQYEPSLRVALVDPQGQEVAASSVTSDENEVTLTAPAVTGPAKYTVTATFKNGVGEETVIRNVTIGGATAPLPAAGSAEGR